MKGLLRQFSGKEVVLVMQMSNEEIIRAYKNAKNPGRQINVLAQLNNCHSDKIKDILISGGVLASAAQNEEEAAQTGGAPLDEAKAAPIKKDSGSQAGEKMKEKAKTAVPKLDYTMAMELYREGKNDSEIAAAIGAKSRSTIGMWRRKNNLLPQTKRNVQVAGLPNSAAMKLPVPKKSPGWWERFEAVLLTASPDDSLSVRMAYRDLLAAMAPFEFEKALGIEELIQTATGLT